ncbi:hypothetical protein Prum_010600 [Phytohabitans rumicis]|uniref:AB hydrolase-1 domain-containing protein n=2 Tax=Phytohabitans rumicis TaxID=1076125 RepID=A0A6V8KXK6_9ACTN|nr:hypothetical protein Prum_010600 [Phytohabitans rumicis]
MGAQVVTALAVEHPNVVTALVVIDPAYGADAEEERGFDVRLARLRAGGAAAHDQLGSLPSAVRDQLLATPGPVLAACYAGMYTDPGACGARAGRRRRLFHRPKWTAVGRMQGRRTLIRDFLRRCADDTQDESPDQRGIR